MDRLIRVARGRIGLRGGWHVQALRMCMPRSKPHGILVVSRIVLAPFMSLGYTKACDFAMR